MQRLQAWPKHEFLPMKRECNQRADWLANIALQHYKREIVASGPELQNLVLLNGLDELIAPKNTDLMVKIAAVTRSALRSRKMPEALREEVVQMISIMRMKQAQEEEGWIST